MLVLRQAWSWVDWHWGLAILFLAILITVAVLLQMGVIPAGPERHYGPG